MGHFDFYCIINFGDPIYYYQLLVAMPKAYSVFQWSVSSIHWIRINYFRISDSDIPIRIIQKPEAGEIARIRIILFVSYRRSCFLAFVLNNIVNLFLLLSRNSGLRNCLYLNHSKIRGPGNYRYFI